MPNHLTDYDTSLFNRIKNERVWPTLNRTNFLVELKNVGENAYKKGTTEGYLAAVIIYQQITEELLKVLIDYSTFLIQVAIWPAKYEYNIKNKAMFGELLSNFENTVSFKNKDLLIKECKELNSIRIKIVHRLTLKTSIADIQVQTKNVQKTFTKILNYYYEANVYYLSLLEDYKRDTDWDLLSE